MANRYWVGGTGNWDTTNTANWSDTSGGTSGASAPTTADAVIFDANSGIGVCSITENVPGLRLTMTGYTGTLAFSTNKISLSGSSSPNIYSGATTYTVTGTPLIELTSSASTGTRVISAGSGVTESNSISFTVLSGTDTVTIGGSVRNVNLSGFSGTLNNSTRSVFGNLTLSSAMALNSGTLATTLAATSNTNTITTNGKTLDFPLVFNGVGGTFAFQDALTQGSTKAFTITNGTVQLKAGVTSTVGAFATSGTNQKFLESTMAGSQATLSQASGTVNASNLTIKDINATGGATFNAFISNGNINAGNNLGWDFQVQLGRYIYTRRKNKRILL